MKPTKTPGDFAARPIEDLIGQWLKPARKPWNKDAELYRKYAERFLKAGECILVHDVAAEGLEVIGTDPECAALRLRLRQLQGLALARSGASRKANEIFALLYKEGHKDEETLGVLARTHKDLGLGASGSERAAHLRRSHALYAEAYAGNAKNYWTGINAATTALLLGEREKTRELALEVRGHCLAQCRGGKPPREDPYWLPATIAEAALILGEVKEAEQWYRRAVAAAPQDWGSIASTRRAARLIADAIGDKEVRACVDQWLHVPNVVVFAGHMIDQPERSIPRFPASLEGAVRAAISDKLAELDAGFGFASGACGSDILFLKAMRDREGEINIVLPYEQEGFIKDSVNLVPGSTWGKRLARLTKSRNPIIASPQRVRLQSVTYDYANILLHGLAKIRADQLETRLIPLAVWNRQEGDGQGGTADVVRRWRALGCEPAIVDLDALLRAHQTRTKKAAPAASRISRGAPVLPRGIKYMLFADVVKFSRIPEESFPHYVKHFLGGVARLTGDSLCKPVIRNTWGDALFFVFDSVEEAGGFALDLRDFVEQTEWTALGFESGLNLRIAVHAGPVFAFEDPVAGIAGCVGSHVNRAARHEPVTPPGHVYASQEFAALAALRKPPFVCDYAGRIPLPKNFGTFPTYHVRRR
jgi:class 3 adenylate cyclase/tetratricopeptide (TPR) repeat protein